MSNQMKTEKSEGYKSFEARKKQKQLGITEKVKESAHWIFESPLIKILKFFAFSILFVKLVTVLWREVANLSHEIKRCAIIVID